MNRRILRIAGLTVAGLFVLWLAAGIGVALASGSARSEVLDRIPALSTLGRHTAEAMRSTRVDPRRRASTDCRNVLRIGPTEVLFYDAGAVPDLISALHSWTAAAASPSLQPVEGQIQGMVWGELTSIHPDTPVEVGFVDDLGRVLGSAPWTWAEQIDQPRTELPNLTGGRYLVVSLIRELSPATPEEVGATGAPPRGVVHMRVVDIAAESTLCEGFLESADDVPTNSDGLLPLRMTSWLGQTPQRELCPLGGTSLCLDRRRGLLVPRFAH